MKYVKFEESWEDEDGDYSPPLGNFTTRFVRVSEYVKYNELALQLNNSRDGDSWDVVGVIYGNDGSLDWDEIKSFDTREEAEKFLTQLISNLAKVN